MYTPLALSNVWFFKKNYCYRFHTYRHTQLQPTPSIQCYLRANHLILDNQLVSSSLGKTSPLPPTFSVACSSLSEVEASQEFRLPRQHVHWCGVVIVWDLFRRSCWCDFVCIASLTFLVETISQQTSRFLALTIFLSSSAMIPGPWVKELCYRSTRWNLLSAF